MRERPRQLLAAAGVVTVVGIALVVIVATSTLSLPSFPRLAERSDPDIDGTVAFVRHEGYGEGCLFTVRAAGGTPRELRCDVGTWFGPVWTDEGELLVAASMHGWTEAEVALVIDSETGETVGRRELTPKLERERAGSTERADGTVVVADSDEGRAELALIEPDGTRKTLLSVTGPRHYGFPDVSWSPDDEWVLVVDTAQRLLIVDPRDGRTRVLATDAEQAAWYQASE